MDETFDLLNCEASEEASRIRARGMLSSGRSRNSVRAAVWLTFATISLTASLAGASTSGSRRIALSVEQCGRPIIVVSILDYGSGDGPQCELAYESSLSADLRSA